MYIIGTSKFILGNKCDLVDPNNQNSVSSSSYSARSDKNTGKNDLDLYAEEYAKK